MNQSAKVKFKNKSRHAIQILKENAKINKIKIIPF